MLEDRGNEGAGEAGEEKILINAPCPMPHAQCPMPNAPCPIPRDYYAKNTKER
ncbi:histidine kinase [Nostoc sp. UHCC 0251]|uniref:histidine kinase n=1 Tax=Nostoc sp. UHCC 0251 TaxID=3110240 RepID=UPI002B202C6E|nr:histidine kinase [Nostoc sp. UHCC 0251]MEA5623441.1 histidine kinase [Nostoc sp. UHCC 0251]